jgi:hypothetical protein
MTLLIPEAAGLTGISFPEGQARFDELPLSNGFHRFDCFGTRCDGLRLRLHLRRPGRIPLLIYDTTSGLPGSGAHLLEARPNTASPSQGGDVTWILNEVVVGE